MQVYGERFEGRVLTIGTDPVSDSWSFGGGTEVVDCRLTLADERSVHFFCAAVTGTTIHVRRRRARLKCVSVFFRGCTFTGRYSDTRFGLTSDDADLCTHAGGLADCDFSAATLDFCTFHNCDPATLRFPGWPHFTVIHPGRNAADWLATPFPEWFRPSQEGLVSTLGVAAITVHWPTYLRERKRGDTDTEAVRQILAGKDYVVM